LAWIDLAGPQLAKIVELRLYETIDPLKMTGLSLAALLAIGDNAIIHKLRVLPTDQLLILLQLPTADLKPVATTATPDELGWLAGYLATLPSKQASVVADELASGKQTIAALQAPPTVATELAQSTGDSSSSTSGASGTAQSDSAGSGSASNHNEPGLGTLMTQPLSPAGIVPFLATLWMMGANNGVVVAAAVLVVLCIAVGVALALQRQVTNPPL
jgi:hypothetical protein